MVHLLSVKTGYGRVISVRADGIHTSIWTMSYWVGTVSYRSGRKENRFEGPSRKSPPKNVPKYESTEMETPPGMLRGQEMTQAEKRSIHFTEAYLKAVTLHPS